ncbi:hypothetical protein QTP86_011502 [Hemibagrus guttatus]|nr:hypothetical protein QTP86_011502 [Hemibagrus guttatus]
MPPGRLPGEVFWACPTGKRPRGRPRTRWRDYVFQLAWECLGVPPEELEEVAREREGIHVLNYLDDWLILAHSKAMAASHRDSVLAHMRSLGLRINPENCAFSISENHLLGGDLGFHHNAGMSISCSSILSAVNAVCLDQSFSVVEAQRIFGLMAAACNVIPLGLLHMRFWLRVLAQRCGLPSPQASFVPSQLLWEPEQGSSVKVCIFPTLAISEDQTYMCVPGICRDKSAAELRKRRTGEMTENML